jgi:hypothetical protein
MGFAFVIDLSLGVFWEMTEMHRIAAECRGFRTETVYGPSEGSRSRRCDRTNLSHDCAYADTHAPELLDLSIASRISWFRAPNSKSGKQFSSRPMACTRSCTSNTFISK